MRDILRRAKQTTVLRNAGYLYGIQFLDLVLPLLIVPYVVRVLGPSGFGVVSFVLSFVSYFGLTIDYGFNITATRDVTLAKGNLDALSKVFSETICTKAVLFFGGLLVAIAACAFTSALRGHLPLILLAYLSLLGNVLVPTWLYQGVEEMATLLWSSVATKLLMVVLVLLLVRKPGHEAEYLASISFTQALNALITIRIANRRFGVKLRSVQLARISRILRYNVDYFVNNLSVSVYLSGNAFLLGLFCSPAQVGLYAGAEKIARAVVGLLIPLSQAVFPRSIAYREEPELSLRRSYYRRMAGALVGVGLSASLGLFVLAPFFARLILGTSFEGATPLLRMMSPLPFLVALAIAFGTQILVVWGRVRTVTFFAFLACAADLICLVSLVGSMREMAGAVAVLAAEATIGILSFLAAMCFRLHLREVQA